MPLTGSTVTLEVQYYNSDGDLYTPADPRVDIIDSLGATRVTDAVVTMTGTGVGEYDYGPIPATPLGLWHGHFTGTDGEGAVMEGDDFFEVSAAPTVTTSIRYLEVAGA